MTMTRLPSMQTYQLLGPLDEGGMGRVSDSRIELPLRQSRSCAIKSIRESKIDLRYVMLFVREAMIGWDVTGHPNVVNTRSFGTWEDGSLFLVTDREGPALDLVTEDLRGRYPLIRRIAQGILRALVHLRRKGVAHCDISPANILLGRDGNAKISDFGLARRADDAAPLRIESISVGMIGVPAYASPEVIGGATQSHESDLYSLGAVLHELVTGEPPARSAEAGEDHLSPDDAPADLVELINGLLRDDPRARLPAGEGLAILEASTEPKASWEEIAAIAEGWLGRRDAKCTTPLRVATGSNLFDLAEQYVREWDDRERQRTRQAAQSSAENAPETLPTAGDAAPDPQERARGPATWIWMAAIGAAALIAFMLGSHDVWQWSGSSGPGGPEAEGPALVSGDASQAADPAGATREGQQTVQGPAPDREPAEIAGMTPSPKAEPSATSAPAPRTRPARSRFKRPRRAARPEPVPAQRSRHRDAGDTSSPDPPAATWATPNDWQ